MTTGGLLRNLQDDTEGGIPAQNTGCKVECEFCCKSQVCASRTECNQTLLIFLIILGCLLFIFSVALLIKCIFSHTKVKSLLSQWFELRKNEEEIKEMDKPDEPDQVGFTFDDQNSILNNSFYSLRENGFRSYQAPSRLDYSKYTNFKGKKVNYEELKLNRMPPAEPDFMEVNSNNLVRKKNSKKVKRARRAKKIPSDHIIDERKQSSEESEKLEKIKVFELPDNYEKKKRKRNSGSIHLDSENLDFSSEHNISKENLPSGLEREFVDDSKENGESLMIGNQGKIAKR
ncbi:unnamed protein product [Moneuplotes crassus]|uniref:Uncharacterized protein n=1 Tax=Euplotes crassus TaxID=5936 RepID=A0AAD2CXJ6_EUPCR|nr:unnamed protein product [Moneuplotes crassus]